MRKTSEKYAKEKGITLIALIITIVVMLILVTVSIQIALDTGMFENAGQATKKWSAEQEKESQLGNGQVTIGGVTYDSIDEYMESFGKNNYEDIFATAEKHPEQSATNNDIGIAEDGSIVNLDLWAYNIMANNTYTLHNDTGSGGIFPGYSNSNITEDGKIQGKVPMYIKEEGKSEYYPVTSMKKAFYGCYKLKIAPEIPSTVIDMESTFEECHSLNTAPVISGYVTNLNRTFYNCLSLNGTLEINTKPISYVDCLSMAAVGDRDLKLTGNNLMGILFVYSTVDMGYIGIDKDILSSIKKHPEQLATNNDIGIAEDGSIVNLDLWNYSRQSSGYYTLSSEANSSLITPGYSNAEIAENGGKIQGKVPMFIIEESGYYEIVTSMCNTFLNCTNLTTAPEIPSTVTNLSSAFEGCTSLTGTLTINSTPTSYNNCLYKAATDEGCNLVLNGSCDVNDLKAILATKSSESNITIEE